MALAVARASEGVKKSTISRKDAKAQGSPRINPLVSLRLCVFAPSREMFLLGAGFFHTFSCPCLALPLHGQSLP